MCTDQSEVYMDVQMQGYSVNLQGESKTAIFIFRLAMFTNAAKHFLTTFRFFTLVLG